MTAKEEREYWLEKLSAEIPLSGVACDLQPGAERLPGLCRRRLSPDLTRQLDRLCGGSDFLLYAMLLAAVKLCLMRYSGNRIIAVASPSLLEAGTANALVIVSHLSETMTYQELLLAVRENLIEAYGRQRYPLSRLRRDLGDAGQRRWYEVGVRLEGLHGNLAGEPPRLLLSGRRKREIEVECEYDAGLYEAATVERLLRHCEQALREGTGGGRRRLEEIEIEEESRRLRLAGEAREYGADETMVEELREVGRRHAEAVAVVSGDHALSYGDLHGRANQLARYLREKGVRAESPVGVLMGRGPWLMVSLLGVLKAGGAYAPLEAGARERLRSMVEESGMKVALVDEAGAGEARGEVEEVIEVEREWEEIGRRGREEMELRVSGENLAYVIYTSGSTGRPKGVMNTHRGIRNRLLWMQEQYRLTREDAVLQKTPLTFDVSVWELFWPLMTGARLVMVKPEGHKDSQYLARVIAEQAVTALHFVPSMLRAFLEEEELRHCDVVKRVICSGEALTPELRDRFHARMKAGLHNLYGPTEAAIDVTFHACAREDNRRALPIGKPIANTEILILDQRSKPAPAGVSGHLHIGGVGVARGYLHRPDLTAERFIPNAYGAEPGARVYAAGDLCRLLDDGNIEYLGRIDHQVKLRGYRIELGEIEDSLRRHPDVREAVVTLREAGDGDKQLVAYVTPVRRPPALAEDLRTFLKTRLPEYMLPGAIIELDALPLTSSGKVDRKSLPAVNGQSLRHADVFVAPRNPVEDLIASIWSEVLGAPRVGVTDDYFALGGHSLKAVKIMSRVRKAFQVDLPLPALFMRPTVAALAEEVAKAAQTDRRPQIPTLKSVPRAGDLPLSFAQQRLWMIDQLSPGNPVYNILLPMRLMGVLDAQALKQSLNEIVRRHEALRASFDKVDGRPRQIIASELRLELPVEDVRPSAGKTEDEIAGLSLEEACRPFDLAKGPLARARLLRLGEQDHVFLLTVHHIVCDGLSLEIIARELRLLYTAFSEEKPSPLPEPPLQYADYAYWQREWLTDDLMESQVDYWRRQLKDLPPALALPEANRRAESLSYEGASQAITLDAESLARLRLLAGREGVTLFMTLLALLKVLLHRYTGQEDLVVGANLANRNNIEVEGLVGLFLNQVVLRTRVSGNPAFREILQRVREVVLGAFLHQDLPFDQVLDELKARRDLSQGVLFQVKVDYQQAAADDIQIDGLAMEPMDIDTGMAKFDLSFLLLELRDELSISLVYNRRLFEAATIAGMLASLDKIMRMAVANPDHSLRQLMRQLDRDDRQRRINQQRELKNAGSEELKTVRRRPVIL